MTIWLDIFYSANVCVKQFWNVKFITDNVVQRFIPLDTRKPMVITWMVLLFRGCWTTPSHYELVRACSSTWSWWALRRYVRAMSCRVAPALVGRCKWAMSLGVVLPLFLDLWCWTPASVLLYNWRFFITFKWVKHRLYLRQHAFFTCGGCDIRCYFITSSSASRSTSSSFVFAGFMSSFLQNTSIESSGILRSVPKKLLTCKKIW